DYEQWRQDMRENMIMEALFYARVRNRALSGLMGINETQIAVIRHRLMKRLRNLIEEAAGDPQGDEPITPSPDLLTRIWERDRPSCPKRTTLGKSLLGILDDSWQQYVVFHVQTLGCRYCQANLEDLREEGPAETRQARSQRIFQSTIGFVSHP
ncbi:MAG: RNA polymerase subunit sigma, partial [Pirellulales bacterium]|nr:RNA polymerase subunit sigma [Pirellulales bacterium]